VIDKGGTVERLIVATNWLPGGLLVMMRGNL
jgi:hypothetical protein